MQTRRRDIGTAEPVVRTANADAYGSTRAAILDAAERIFGTHGFDGGSMREIAQEAGIAQSLLHYHFHNKSLLFEAVFERRAVVIHKVRAERLAAASSGAEPMTLEAVLGILFMPLEALLDERRSDLRFYVQMLAEVTMSADVRSIEIIRRLYDPSAEQFVDAFRAIMPELSRAGAVWAYLFAIGARMQAHNPSNRAERLGASRATASPYELLIPFVAAGVRAIANSPAGSLVTS